MTPQATVPKAPRGALERHRLTRPLRELPPEKASLDMEDVLHGVSAGWLAKVFSMDPLDVKRRLADCPSIERGKQGHVYDLKAATRFLVKPAIDVRRYLETMKPSELPPQLQDTYWKSRLSRQKFEENAGDLWRSEDVISVLGEVFKTIKFSMQLWADNLERRPGLTPEQRVALVQMVDALQNDIHHKLVKMPESRKTPSSGNEEGVVYEDFGLV